jgi:putative redox protein
MVEMKLEYEGDLHCRATHGPSGTVLATDAPKDNRGRGESFSPTDLVATALGACMLTILAIKARDEGIDLGRATAAVTKEMVSEPTRRIGRLGVTIRIPLHLPNEAKWRLEAAALGCPVAKSLSPDVEVAVTFKWGERA